MGQSAFLGTASVVELLGERDPDVLLAVQAANVAAAQMLDDALRRHAVYTIRELAEAWK